MSRLLREICQLEKPPANEITKLLAFTVCRVELRGKAIVLQSRRFRRTCFRAVVKNNSQNRIRKQFNKIKETKELVPKCDYKEAFLTDRESKIESV